MKRTASGTIKGTLEMVGEEGNKKKASLKIKGQELRVCGVCGHHYSGSTKCPHCALKDNK